MLLIRHRVNTVEDLKTVPLSLGIELDLRYEGRRLILHHDPFVAGEDFENFLAHYRHALIILNVKSEGIENAVLELLKKYRVQNYFFLDLSLPALIKLARQGERRIAVRFSEYEPLEQALVLAGKVEWAWIDCFNDLPLNESAYAALKRHFKLCLVSPELQGYGPERIEEFKKKLANYEMDAVCTKYPERWSVSCQIPD